ncbi:hypothetical protein FGB62_161g06 [Gracilaria domingensis]|nr:hypothetical protein FGB62_161g06 [Gracilaria domingensis]
MAHTDEIQCASKQSPSVVYEIGLKNSTLQHRERPGRGKNSTWNEAERIAVTRAAAAASTDPATGSNMSGAKCGRRIRALFIKDGGSPKLYLREDWKKLWEKTRDECTKLKPCYDRDKAMIITENPHANDLLRCVEPLYSDGSRSVSHPYLRA